MIDALARELVRHRGRWTGVALLVLGVSVAAGSRLSLRHEASDFVPAGLPAVDPVTAGGAAADRVVVLLEADQVIPVTQAGPVLDQLASRLAAINGVRRVEYRVPRALRNFLEDYAPRHLLLYFEPAELDTLGSRLTRAHMERALLGAEGGVPRSVLANAMGATRTDPLDVIGPAAHLLRRLSGNTRVRLVDGYFALPDQRAFFLTVEPAQRLAGIDSARAVVDAIRAAVASVQRDPALAGALAGKRLSVLGRPVAYVEGFDVALGDIRRVGLASAIAVFLLLLLTLRRPLAPVFIVGTVLFGLAVTAAIAWVVFGSISLIGWVFIASLIGFGDEFALYITTHYWISTAPEASRAEALASALRRPGPGLLLGGLTSAAAFFSLVAVSYPVMVQLAWLSTIGLLLILACSFTVLPLALSYTAPGQESESRWYRRLARAAPVNPRHNVPWLVAWGVLVAVSLWSARRVRVDTHPWRQVVRGLGATAELERVQRRLGASFTPIRMISRGATADEALAQDRAAVRALDRIRHRAGVAAIVSLSRWLPPAEQQRADSEYLGAHAALFSRERFERDFTAVVSAMQLPDTALLTRYLPLVSRYLDPRPHEISLDSLRQLGLDDFIGQHLERAGDQHVVISDVYLTRLPWAKGVVDRFTTAVGTAGGPALSRMEFAGEAMRGATRPAVLRRDFIAATSLTALLVVAVLGARFRRVSLVLLCLLPLGAGLVAALGLMGLLGIDLNVLTIAVAPLIIGVGSDDGIHIVDRLERGEPMSVVLRDTGTPMIITTLTTIAAFACLGLATFPGVREVGLVAATGLAVCLWASLQLLPVVYGMVNRT